MRSETSAVHLWKLVLLAKIIRIYNCLVYMCLFKLTAVWDQELCFSPTSTFSPTTTRTSKYSSFLHSTCRSFKVLCCDLMLVSQVLFRATKAPCNVCIREARGSGTSESFNL